MTYIASFKKSIERETASVKVKIELKDLMDGWSSYHHSADLGVAACISLHGEGKRKEVSGMRMAHKEK